MLYARVMRKLAILDSNAYSIIARAEKYDQSPWLMGALFVVRQALVWWTLSTSPFAAAIPCGPEQQRDACQCTGHDFLASGHLPGE